MLEYMMMRKELLGYIIGIIQLHDELKLTQTNDVDYHAAWARQMFANDFILDDINVSSEKSDWIGVIFYDGDERAVIRKVGSALNEFYLVGEAGDYVAAFKSPHWKEAYIAAKASLELMRQNDINPPR